MSKVIKKRVSCQHQPRRAQALTGISFGLKLIWIKDMKTLPTGSTIGIFGGGQLGRMIAMDAARLGYRCHIFCASEDEPALDVCAAQTIASFDDEAAIEAFAKAVDVITLEW